MKFALTGIDFILILFYFLIIMGIGYAFSNKIPYLKLRQYFLRGLLLKLFCGLGFGWIYVYYYGGGDTTMYFNGASNVFDAFMSGDGMKALFTREVLTHGSPATILTQKIAGFINLFAFNSFWACTLLFSGLTFIGQWLLFLSFFRLFPKLHKSLALATLFIPGVIFWSSGIMKDSICFLFVGVVVYSIQNVFLYKKNILSNSAMILLSFLIITNLKAYISLALIAAIAIYAFFILKDSIKNKALKILLLPFVIIGIGAGAFLAMNRIGESLQRYSLENLIETAEVYQNYHSRTSLAGRGATNVRTGSAYDLGEVNFNSPLNLASKFPLAVNVTYFRPYIWEVKNPVMLLAAIESTIIFCFFLSILYKKGLKGFFRIAFNNKEVAFCLTFALIFGFAVGFSSYNFGSLVRYKAPCVPFFLVALIIINAAEYKKKETTSLLVS